MSVRAPFQTSALLAFVLVLPALAGVHLADALAGPEGAQISATGPLGVPATSAHDGVAFEATADYEVVVTATRLPADDVAFEATADYEVVVTATALPADDVAFEATADYEVVVTTTSVPS